MCSEQERMDEAMAESAVLNPVAESLAQSLKEMQQIRKGQLEANSWDDFMKDLESEDDQ